MSVFNKANSAELEVLSFSEGQIKKLSVTAVVNSGGPGGTRRLLMWPSALVCGSVHDQMSWFDMADDEIPTGTTSRYRIEYGFLGGGFSKSDRYELGQHNYRVPREVFDRVWDEAVKRP